LSRRIHGLWSAVVEGHQDYGFIASAVVGFISSKFFGATLWMGLGLASVFLVLAGPMILVPLYDGRSWFEGLFKPAANDLFSFLVTGLFGMAVEFAWAFPSLPSLYILFIFGVFGWKTMQLGRFTRPSTLSKSAPAKRTQP
jgi:hypothetical protein